MSEKSVAFEYCDKMVEDFEKVIEHPVREKSSVYYTGVDLGTACVVIAVLDENKRPVAGAYRYADVVRDGMVVDYIGAVQIVRELKEQIEEQLDTELIYAAGAIPPGTDLLDSGAVKNVIQGAGFNGCQPGASDEKWSCGRYRRRYDRYFHLKGWRSGVYRR